MPTNLTGTTTVKELLISHPHLLHTFIALGLKCVGCPAGAFHTLADVAREYGFKQTELISHLRIALGPTESAGDTKSGLSGKKD